MPAIAKTVLRFARYSLILPAAMLACAVSAPAQSEAVTPSPDDPVLYLLFLSEHDSMYRDVEADRAKNAARALIREKQLAENMHLRVEDVAEVASVYRRLAAKFEVIDAEANAYRDSVIAKKGMPDLAKIKGFSDRRDQALAQAIAELHHALAPSAWNDLKAFVTGPYRAHIRVGRGAK